MPTRETAPSFLEDVLVGLGADGPCDQRIVSRAAGWFAPRKQIRARPSHRILDDVCQDGSEHESHQKAEHGDLGLMHTGV